MMYLGNQAVGLNSNTIQLISTYTLEESWENDTLGNPVTIINTLLPNLSSYSPQYIFLLVFKNNNATNKNYKVDYILTANVAADNNSKGGFTVRNNYTASRQNNTATSSWASIGTIVNIYKLKGGDT